MAIPVLLPLINLLAAPAAGPGTHTQLDGPGATDPWLMLTVATAFLVTAAAAAIAELHFISFGILTGISLSCAVTAVWLAFSVSELAGWGFLAATTVGLFLIFRWSGEILRRSSAVPKAMISGDAGYHHALHGLKPGDEGELTTPAQPTGRCRFILADGPMDCDVACATAAAKGTRVRVVSINGPVVHVDSVIS